MARSPRSPLSPREGWLSDGRQVLHFRPLRHSRWNQTLELTSGERLAGEPIPLLKRRRVLQREEAIRLWNRRLEQGWRPCPPQWQPPSPLARIGTALPSGAALPTDKPHNGG